ncbi:MAG: hypothetical protein JWM65_1863 [Sphingomonas bacterium]|jgi:hypothetical protein|nr:hypothetical protein [Sphingomonas bacterium]
MTATSHQGGSSFAKRAEWRTPSLTEDAIADITMNQENSPGDDGLDQFPGYETTGNS